MSAEIQLFADVSTERLTNRDGGNPTLPPFVLGDTKRFQLTLQERTADGLQVRNYNVRSVRAALGKVMEPPKAGAFRVRRTVGDVIEDSAAVLFNGSAAALSAQLADYVPGFTVAEVQKPADGLFLVRFNEPGEAPLEINAGELQPASFGRVRAYQIGTVWWHEIALIQTPAAFSNHFERVLPPAPRIERVRSGAARVPGSSANTNEVQRLYLPPNFNGSYSLAFDYRRTALLGPQDDHEQIAAFLNALYKDSKTRFSATNPENDFAYIEFTGPLEAAPQELIQVQVHSFAPGVITFELFLGRPELAALLRDVAEIELPLEIELEIVDDDDDAADPSIPGRFVTIAQQKVKVFREQITPELQEVPAIDWLKPPTPRSYIPFSPLQVITGQQHHVSTFGDGVARAFSIVHGLSTPALSSLEIRENKPAGRFLVRGTDYSAKAGSDPANEVHIDLLAGFETPPLNGLAAVITSAGPRSAFQEHPHPMEQVTGLIDYLAGFAERLSNIEDRLPFTAPGVRDEEAAEDEEIALPDFFAQYPGRFDADAKFDKPQKAHRRGAFLPAILQQNPEELPETLPDPAAIKSTTFSTAGGITVASPGAIGDTFVWVGSQTEDFPLIPGDTFRFSGIPGSLGAWTYTVTATPGNGARMEVSPPLKVAVAAGTPIAKGVRTYYRGTVYKNVRNVPFDVSGGLGMRAFTLQPNEYVACDGRLWYKVRPEIVEHGITPRHYYPADYERELFTLPISAEQLRPGGELAIEFTTALQMIDANVKVSALIVVEVGTPKDEKPPTWLNVLPNLQEIEWNPTPLFAQRVIVSSQKHTAKLGAAVRRGLDNSMSADRLLYGVWSAAAAAPAGSNFVLRARVVSIDPENSPTDARGSLWIGMTEATATISNA